MKKIFSYFLLIFFFPLGYTIPNFYAFMGKKNPSVKYSEKMPFWEKLYYQNNFEVSSYSEKEKIPKIIHQIWLGSKLPEKYAKYAKSWIKVHPDWTYKLWTDDDIKDFPFINKKAFDAAENFGAKSDIWRYEILNIYGGLYIDTDFEAIKPMDILHHTHSFYVGLFNQATPNGLFGAAVGHPILKECIRRIQQAFYSHDFNDIMQNTGPYFFAQVIYDIAQESPEGICTYPTFFFYPFPATLRHEYWKGKFTQQQIQKFIKNESFTIHYWATSWQK